MWFDQSELSGGDAWDEKIRREIRDWKLAVGRTHGMADGKPFLVPVVIDGTRDQDARVPELGAARWPSF